jgi:putative transposase
VPRSSAKVITLPLGGHKEQRILTHSARQPSVPIGRPWVATLVRTIFDQPDAAEVHAQYARVVAALEAKLPAAAEHLSAARDDLLASTAAPQEIWRQVWSSNSQERLSKGLRRRTDVAGILPDRPAIIRLVGAVLMEQNDEWAESHRYIGRDILVKVSAFTPQTPQAARR